MEFTNEIFFNKKLIQGETVLITYSGKLYKEYSSEITIVYGFGNNWDYTQETKMQEKENGFEALITLKDYNTFNFCFKNNYNIWDNNSGFNYIATVEAAPETEDKADNSENTAEIEQTTDNQKSDDYIEKAFSDLLDSILQFNQENLDQNINLDSGFGLQSVDKVNEVSEVDVNVDETDFTSCDDIFQKMYEELTSQSNAKDITEDTYEELTSQSNAKDITEDTYEEITSYNTEDTDKEITSQSNIEDTNKISDDFQKTTTQSGNENETNSDLESLLNDISTKENEKEKHKPITSEELDALMENILNSIVEDESKEDNIQNTELANDDSKKDNIQNAESTDSEESNLPVVQVETEDFLDIIIDKSINFFGSIWKACKKVGTLIKEAAKDLFTEND